MRLESRHNLALLEIWLDHRTDEMDMGMVVVLIDEERVFKSGRIS